MASSFVLLTVLLAGLEGLSLPERIETISGRLLGKPYVSGPLGEGPSGRFDRDPLCRLDAFDCTTYVETVLALANCSDPRDFPAMMDSIRYRHATVGFDTRLHFTCVDWVPANIAAGFLKDATRRIAGSRTALATGVIDQRGWYERMKPESLSVPGLDPKEQASRLAELRALGRNIPEKAASLPYIPLEALLGPQGERLRSRIPSGSVINIVRPGWDLRESIGTRLNVSHQGFAIRRDGKLLFRHASSGKQKAVVETDFEGYLQSCRGKPAMGGINVLTPRAVRR